MGGEIGVSSKQNSGSRFTVLLPLVLANKADLELKDQTVFMNPYSPPDSKGEKADEDEPVLPGLGDDSDDDISDLLKYCEEKLND